jgi:hypothetical protein
MLFLIAMIIGLHTGVIAADVPGGGPSAASSAALGIDVPGGGPS